MRRNEGMLLAGLLDKLADLLEEITNENYKNKTTDEKDRIDKEIQSVCRQIKLCLAKGFQIKTPTGEQRTISGVAK